MILDRTQKDVEDAIFIRREKVQKFIDLTEEDIEKLEKGFLTVNTLNRIEQKVEELKANINKLGYWNNAVSTRGWEYTDFFYQKDFDTIQNNIRILRDSFFVYSTTPSIGSNNYRNFKIINYAEKILSDLGDMIEDVKKGYIECGTVSCGEV